MVVVKVVLPVVFAEEPLWLIEVKLELVLVDPVAVVESVVVELVE